MRERIQPLLVIPVLLLWSCSDQPSPPPSVNLVADPGLCDVPCEVIFDAGTRSMDGRSLSFTWTVDGTQKPGGARLLHTFGEEGVYEVSVTVSDGSSTTTDSLTVEASAQPKTTGTVDPSGGTVSHGACTVTVPDGIAPAAFPLQITALPSMEAAAERVLGPETFTSLSSAFDVSMPAKSNVAIDVAVRSSEARPTNSSELAWLVRIVSTPMPSTDRALVPSSVAPLADYILAPVTRVDEDGTAHGDIYGSKRVQLVKLASPLDVESGVSTSSVREKDAGDPTLIAIFDDPPITVVKAEYLEALRQGIVGARRVLMDELTFHGPLGPIVIFVGEIEDGLDGYVGIRDHDTIHLSNALGSADKIKKVVAHEFFHLIQNMHSNAKSATSYFEQDKWFKEGTAAWAMDEVFDDIQDNYYATTWRRFYTPLLETATDDEPRLPYETVAFWKWVETKNPDAIRSILIDRYLATHETAQGLLLMIESTTSEQDYLTSLRNVLSDLDFLQFTYDALYEKDFDTAETGKDELWSSEEDTPHLGPPKRVMEARFGQVVFEGTGDSESNPVSLDLKVQPHLAADVLEIEAHDIEGTLHVRLPVVAAPLDARVFVIEAKSNELRESYTVRNLSKKHDDVKLSFDADKKAEIFVVDPRWDYPSGEAAEGKVLAWIEPPCGPLPDRVIDVTPSDDLYQALTTAPAGAAVRLAAGTYNPPIRDWTLPEDEGEWPTQVLLTNLTLAGAGESETTLVMRGGEFDTVGLSTFGRAQIRDLTIDAGPYWGVTALKASGLELCNVTIQTYGADGIQFSQWPGAGDGTIRIYDSTVSYLGGAERHAGMDLYCIDQAGDIDAEIRNSEFSGWYIAVSYTNDSENACTVSVTTDCEGFIDNDNNVLRNDCVAPTCQTVEECPP